MKKISLFILSVLMATVAYSQDCEFYSLHKEGNSLTYENYDKKDKLTGSTTQEVKSVTTEGSKTTILLGITSFDKKGEQVYQNELTAYCDAGVYYIDMENYMNSETMAAYESMEVSVDAGNLDMPSKMKVGDKLADGSITVKVSSSGMPVMTMKTTITDRNVEAKEKVTTKAGTFDCYKISYTITVKTIMNITMTAVEWYAKDVGMVKSESYMKNGKLSGKTILTELKK